MEKTVGKLLLATGLLISGSVACLPMASHATSNTGNIFDCGGKATTTANGVANGETPNPCARSNDGSTQINVRVKDILAFNDDTKLAAGADNAEGGDVIQAFQNMAKFGRLYTSIRSAKPYTISISAEDTNLYNEVEDYNIPARAATKLNGKIDTEKAGWGVANGIQATLPAKGDAAWQNYAYKAITNGGTVFYDGPANDNFTTTNFPVVVTTNSKTPQGMYTADVTFTAAVKPTTATSSLQDDEPVEEVTNDVQPTE